MKTIIIFNIMTTTTIATTFIIATIIATIAITTILINVMTRKRLAGRDAAVETQMVMEDLLPR